METERHYPAAYLPYSTFITGIDHLAAITIPNKIELNTFPSMSSHNKAQMISALKFFKLIDKDGSPQPLLSDLAHKKDERKRIIHKLIEEHYSDIIALDLAKTTVSQLDNALNAKHYNVSGETKKKAKTFLLKAAQEAGFTVHPLLTKITRNRRKGAAKEGAVGASKASKSDTNGNEDNGTPPAPTRSESQEGAEKTIQLRRGGSLTLSYSVNLWELKGEDRNFVFELIDKIDAYEEGTKGSTDSADDALKLD